MLCCYVEQSSGSTTEEKKKEQDSWLPKNTNTQQQQFHPTMLAIADTLQPEKVCDLDFGAMRIKVAHFLLSLCAAIVPEGASFLAASSGPPQWYSVWSRTLHLGKYHVWHGITTHQQDVLNSFNTTMLEHASVLRNTDRGDKVLSPETLSLFKGRERIIAAEILRLEYLTGKNYSERMPVAWVVCNAEHKANFIVNAELYAQLMNRTREVASVYGQVQQVPIVPSPFQDIEEENEAEAVEEEEQRQENVGVRRNNNGQQQVAVINRRNNNARSPASNATESEDDVGLRVPDLPGVNPVFQQQPLHLPLAIPAVASPARVNAAQVRLPFAVPVLGRGENHRHLNRQPANSQIQVPEVAPYLHAGSENRMLSVNQPQPQNISMEAAYAHEAEIHAETEAKRRELERAKDPSNAAAASQQQPDSLAWVDQIYAERNPDDISPDWSRDLDGSGLPTIDRQGRPIKWDGFEFVRQD